MILLKEIIVSFKFIYITIIIPFIKTIDDPDLNKH